MKSLKEKVYARIVAKKFWAFTNHDFLDLGTKKQINQVFYQLVKDGKIKRLFSAVYVRLIYIEKMKMYGYSGSPEDACFAYARKYNWRIVTEGNVSLNGFGISTQVPAHTIYKSTGPSRKYIDDGYVLTFIHASDLELPDAPYAVLMAIQALLLIPQPTNDFEKIMIARFLNDSHIKIDDYKNIEMIPWVKEVLIDAQRTYPNVNRDNYGKTIVDAGVTREQKRFN